MLPGEERAAQPPAPANILPQEDSRLPEPNSGEKPAHRRKAPAPTKVVFAGAGVHQGDVNSDEDLLPGEERAADSLSSGQHSPAGAEQITGSPPPVRSPLTGETQPQTCSLTKSEPNNRLILLFYAAQLVIMTSNKRVIIRF